MIILAVQYRVVLQSMMQLLRAATENVARCKESAHSKLCSSGDRVGRAQKRSRCSWSVHSSVHSFGRSFSWSGWESELEEAFLIDREALEGESASGDFYFESEEKILVDLLLVVVLCQPVV